MWGPAPGFAITPVIVGESFKAALLSDRLAQRGINVMPILHPAVPERLARLRFFVTSRAHAGAAAGRGRRHGGGDRGPRQTRPTPCDPSPARWSDRGAASQPVTTRSAGVAGATSSLASPRSGPVFGHQHFERSQNGGVATRRDPRCRAGRVPPPAARGRCSGPRVAWTPAARWLAWSSSPALSRISLRRSPGRRPENAISNVDVGLEPGEPHHAAGEVGRCGSAPPCRARRSARRRASGTPSAEAISTRRTASGMVMK